MNTYTINRYISSHSCMIGGKPLASVTYTAKTDAAAKRQARRLANATGKTHEVMCGDRIIAIVG